MIRYYLILLLNKLLKGYNFFFITETEAYFINDIEIDPNLNQVVMSYNNVKMMKDSLVEGSE